MSKTELLKYGNYYHIFNCGINHCNIFKEQGNYEYFLKLYSKYIDPVADTYAWVLMPNHFHFLVRVKSIEDLKEDFPFLNLSGLQNLTGLKKPSQFFSNLFNAYTKAFNKRYDRHGSLFERRFKRKKINHIKHLKQVLLYIHNNPVHHGFCNHPIEYSWNSYLSCISVKSTKLKREKVAGWFDNAANFKQLHTQTLNLKKIEEFLEL
ncbi:MAG: transposase [Bacteroidota bacterium]|nr:transposase [Bacteroidota bacterium]